MSMEIYLLTNEAVPTTQAWQKAIEALGFDVRFLKEQSLRAKETPLPAEIQGKTILLELLQTNLNDLRETFPGTTFPEHVGHVHILRWSMTLEGVAAAHQAAAAYLGLVKGLMIDTEEGKLKTPDEAIELARRVTADIVVAEAALRKIVSERTSKIRKN
jgi:hypothetical protein